MPEATKFYVRCYDIGESLTYQIEVDAVTASDAEAHGEIVSETPFRRIPLMPISAAERKKVITSMRMEGFLR